jgi:hypothetical protein
MKRLVLLCGAVLAVGTGVVAVRAPEDPPQVDGPAVGRCAVDPRDGFVYGKVVEVEVDAATGKEMLEIERLDHAGGWTKARDNVRVVECDTL